MTFWIISIWLLVATGGLIAQVGYWCQVLPTLERRGFKPYWPVAGFGQYRQLKAYGRICREKGLSMRWHRYFCSYGLVAPVLVLVWLAIAILDWIKSG